MKNKKFINFLFFIFLTFGVISLIWSNVCHQNEVDIPILGHMNSDIRVNIEADPSVIDKIHLMAGNYEISKYSMKSSDVYATYGVDNLHIYNLGLLIGGNDTDSVVKKIDNMVVTVSHKLFYFTGDDILKFRRSKDGRYMLPNDIKYTKTSTYITDKGAMKHLSFGILSVFYNLKFYVFPLIYFLLAFLIYDSNKDKINFRLNLFKNYAIWWILVLALILRLTDTTCSFWTDELYVASVAGNPLRNFMATFSDAGNPPLFFIFARYWEMLFGKNEALLRILPSIFSILTLPVLYLFVKNFINKKTALLIAFLYAINLYSIHYAQEYRCYSLCMLFSALNIFCVFKILQTKENKYFILYGLLAVLMANTHYFQILVLIGSFFSVIFLLDNKSKLKFFLANLTGALFFLPYFLITSLNKALLDPEFNIMEKQTVADVVGYFNQIFTSPFVSIIVILIAVIISIQYFRNKFFNFENKNYVHIYLHSLCVTVFVFAAAYLISLVRPIIRPYYFVNCLPFVIILIGLTFALPFKNGIIKRVFQFYF